MQRAHVGVRPTIVASWLALAVVLAGSAPLAQAQPFTEAASLYAVEMGDVAWGDYDNDGDLDLLLSGYSWAATVTKLYRNDNGTFVDTAAPLAQVNRSSLAWGDYDNDGDLDILLTGYTGSIFVSKVYRNDSGTFVDIEAALTPILSGGAAWGDYDNDGDLDILLAGNASPSAVAKLYRNDAGVFREVETTLTGVQFAAVAWGDYDDDGDLDILLAGFSPISTKLYRNDAGVFTDVGAALTGVYMGSVAWGDYENDGDLDILLLGVSNIATNTTKLYRNNSGLFAEVAAGLTQAHKGSVAWGDYDNDGDRDVLLAGVIDSSTGVGVSRVLRNDSGPFADSGAGLPAIGDSKAIWGDYDHDGDLDVALIGFDQGAYDFVAKVYRNDGETPNTAPVAPSGLVATVTGYHVDLSWSAGSDAETTPAAGLTYNLRVGTSAGAGNVVPSMAGADGRRLIPALGNAQHGTTAWLTLAPGAYSWSVQTIDGAFEGSAFATEGSFVVVPEPTITGFTPASGAFGATVTLTGTNLTAVTAVAFNGTAASFTVDSDTSITATVPDGATTGPLRLTAPGWTVTSLDSFTVFPPPAITSFTPPSGPLGTSVTVGGTNLTGATALTFNGTGALFHVVDSAAQITATVPLGATTGPIGVTTPGGTATSVDSFTVTSADAACDTGRVLVPDGRSMSFDLAAGEARWLVFGSRPGHSYSVELQGGFGRALPRVTLFRGDDNCGGASSATVRDTSLISPAVSGVRFSTTATGTNPGYHVLVESASASVVAFQASLSETSLLSPAWSTNGSYDTYYSLQNTTNAELTAHLVFTASGGTSAGETTLVIPAGTTVSTNTASLAITPGATGTALVRHDGPAGALLVQAAIANFTLTPAYVQPVKFQTLRETR